MHVKINCEFYELIVNYKIFDANVNVNVRFCFVNIIVHGVHSYVSQRLKLLLHVMGFCAKKL